MTASAERGPTAAGVRCTIVRGGTSKGVILRREDLPSDPARRDPVILSIFGSPDRRQIDGLGGADPLTSKVAIVGPPTRDDADIDYTFGQVLIDRPHVDYGGYCGNILSAVAAYAVDERFVAPSEPMSRVRVHVTNTGRIVVADVSTLRGKARETGDCAIAGVPGTAAPIEIDFAGTAGSTTGRLLPTGNPVDEVPFDGRRIPASVLDIGNPMIFLRLDDLGVAPAEGPDELDQRRDLIEALERMRIETSRRIGIVMADGSVSDHIPLVAMVGPPAAYTAYGSGQPLAAAAMDLCGREAFCGRVHKAYGVGETVCTAAAALYPGTVVNAAAGARPLRSGRVRVGHPSGVIAADVDVAGSRAAPEFRRISILRTARRIMDGIVHPRETLG